MLVVVLCCALSPSEPSEPLPDRFVEAASPRAQQFSGFIANEGQWNSTACFVGQFSDLVVRAEPGQLVLQQQVVQGDQGRIGVVRLSFEGSGSVRPVGVERSSASFNYFTGADPSRWRRAVPSYKSVTYPDVYTGLDLILHERAGRFEYDLHLAARAALSDVVVRCEGVDNLSLEPDGDLRMDTPLGPLIQHAPMAWQLTADGDEVPTPCTHRLLGPNEFTLEVRDRLPGASLVIDPGLSWATFLGGSGQDSAVAVEISPEGNPIVLGRTNSLNFPTTPGVFDTSVEAPDATVTCFDPSGSSLVFSTVVGGSSFEVANALALRGDGFIAIGGYTASTDYPTLPSSYDATYSGGLFDACLTILTPNGSDIVFSTLMGGSCGEQISGLGFTSTGSLVAAGETCSPNFPTTPSAFESAYAGGPLDSFVACFDPTQTGSAQLLYSTFLGTDGEDRILDLAVATGDEPLVVGQTTSTSFPTTPGAFDVTPGQKGLSGFVSRLAADGSSLVASTHFATGIPMRIAMDGDAVWVAGYANNGFPVTPGAFDPTPNGNFDCVLAQLDDQLSRLTAATYVGGEFNDHPLGLAVDQDGSLIIAGITQSAGYPTTPGAFDTVFGGSIGESTTMVSRLSSDLDQLLYSSYLGPTGAMSSHANGVAVIGPADVVIVGEGAITGFPVTAGAFDTTFNGGDLGGADGYVARMLLEPTWQSLGGALVGSNGLPILSGSGELLGGTPVTLMLRHAKPSAPVTLIIGLTLLNAPFKGGMLIPSPSLLLSGLIADGQGMLVLSSTWPTGLPSHFSFYTQAWIVDSAGPAGLAASNGLSGTTP